MLTEARAHNKAFTWRAKRRRAGERHVVRHLTIEEHVPEEE